jgi:hypothetical protein
MPVVTVEDASIARRSVLAIAAKFNVEGKTRVRPQGVPT